MSSDVKRPYLVAYDYGMGGLWGIILARSEEEINQKYPELGIAHERPSWMTEEDYERIGDVETHDIDGAPWGILNVVLTDRHKRSQ